MTEPKMKLIETTVSEKSVRVRFADEADATTAKEWIELQVPLADLMHPGDPENALDEPELQFLSVVQAAALQHAKAAISREIERLKSLARNTA